MVKRLLCAFLLLFPIVLQAQVGGTGTYEFLNLPVSARSGALGGAMISASESDITLVPDNPALLDSNLSHHATMTYVNYISDINFGYVGYARHLPKYKGTFNVGLRFLSYGRFTETDLAGNELGDFSAGEYAARLDYSRPLDSLFRVGGTVKVIFSSLYQNNSLGMAIDLGGTYLSKNKQFSAGLTVRNAGAQITPYVQGNREPLPFEIRAAISQKLAKAPFRLTLMTTHWTRWDLTYPAAEVEENASDTGSSAFSIDNLSRHLVAGVEYVPSKNFNIRFGYNFQRRQELKVLSRPALAGISFGAMIRIKKFHLAYTLARYHLAGTSNHLTLSTNLSEFRKRN